MSTRKNILVAPLDWGLGHATRCMPLIDLLIRKGHNVIIAGNGDSYYLLKEQYPPLTFYELPGYNITYPAGKSASVQGLLQTPKVLRTIRKEHKAVAEIAEKEQLDLILSDNRYGVRHNRIRSIFIGHQIALQAPHAMRFMNPFFLKLHLQQIRKFDVLWIPDEAGANNLSGKLSHDINFGMPVTYIGIQSRFSEYRKQPSVTDGWQFDILVVLSGPEPQRSFLEEALKEKLKATGQNILLVQGKTAMHTRSVSGNITTVSYLNTNDLYSALQKAGIIICRSGYSTVMDLAVLGKKAILIPAEGQTEQEYLAKTISGKGFAVECRQDNLAVEDALKALAGVAGFPVFTASTQIPERELEVYLSGKDNSS